MVALREMLHAMGRLRRLDTCSRDVVDCFGLYIGCLGRDTSPNLILAASASTLRPGEIQLQAAEEIYNAMHTAACTNSFGVTLQR